MTDEELVELLDGIKLAQRLLTKSLQERWREQSELDVEAAALILAGINDSVSRELFL